MTLPQQQYGPPPGGYRPPPPGWRPVPPPALSPGGQPLADFGTRLLARRLTRGMAAKRYLVENVAGMLVPFLVYLDGLWQLWDKPYQQTLHDKFARTVVVKVSA